MPRSPPRRPHRGASCPGRAGVASTGTRQSEQRSPMTQHDRPAARLDGRMRRNLFLLACCQAIGQAGNTMMFAATALSVVTFYPHRDLATLPVTMQHLGVMLWVFPASMLMQRMGRRFGFRVGSVFGMAGAGVVGCGLYTANFALMCLGGMQYSFHACCMRHSSSGAPKPGRRQKPSKFNHRASWSDDRVRPAAHSRNASAT